MLLALVTPVKCELFISISHVTAIIKISFLKNLSTVLPIVLQIHYMRANFIGPYPYALCRHVVTNCLTYSHGNNHNLTHLVDAYEFQCEILEDMFLLQLNFIFNFLSCSKKGPNCFKYSSNKIWAVSDSSNNELDF